MAHVVTSKCAGCKFTDCVEVCPVACFYELDNQLVIHPEDCIDCTACVDACPVKAIYLESDLPPEFTANTEFNAVEARQMKEPRAGHRGDHQRKRIRCRPPRSGRSIWATSKSVPSAARRACRRPHSRGGRDDPTRTAILETTQPIERTVLLRRRLAPSP